MAQAEILNKWGERTQLGGFSQSEGIVRLVFSSKPPRDSYGWKLGYDNSMTRREMMVKHARLRRGCSRVNRYEMVLIR